ncbi:hypothetical protein [Bradyrhizobium sp. WSM1417]|uniref:hypothetical protein n=1 Tax=Bradyrhizobium sp. WSM1417 TaxID=754500 RepID=UPI00047F79C3|nr:hypothetical protein [Bradyrhizobium sp. WSM1417]
MKSQWRLRDSYFTRAGIYSFEVDGKKLEFSVTKEGLFELEGDIPLGIGVFANRIDVKSRPTVRIAKFIARTFG